jgi:hypothetical protein
MRSDSGKDRIERPNSQRVVRRNGNTVGRWLRGLQNDVAPDLMNLCILPTLAEMLGQVFAAQITRQLHATASTSSRTRRRRIEAGGAESK